MDRHELNELNYITALENLPSILRRGLLSYKKAAKVPHTSVAMSQIQERRDPRIVPGGLPLHDYVNLYLNARNKMMFKIRHMHAGLCVLRIDTDVLDTPGAVVCDGNASSGWSRFYKSPAGLKYIDIDRLFATYWTHDDYYEQLDHGRITCAEVLIPQFVDPELILGAYVSCNQTQDMLIDLAPGINVMVNEHLFFNGGHYG